MKRYKRNEFLTSIKMNVWESWMINVIETITNNENVQIFSWGRHLISIEVSDKIKLEKIWCLKYHHKEQQIIQKSI